MGWQEGCVNCERRGGSWEKGNGKLERGNGNSEKHWMYKSKLCVPCMCPTVFVKRDDNWCIKAENLIGRVLCNQEGLRTGMCKLWRKMWKLGEEK